MPNKCSIAGCRSNYDKEKERVTLFTLPKDEERIKEWLRKIPTDLSGLKSPYICIKHFADSDVIRIDSVSVNGEIKFFERKLPRLKENAVPTIFPNPPKCSSSNTKTRRCLAQSDSKIHGKLKPNKFSCLPKHRKLPKKLLQDGSDYSEIPRKCQQDVLDCSDINIQPIKLTISKDHSNGPSSVTSSASISMALCCCADHCNISFGDGYSLHKFPGDKKLCAAWIYAIHRKGFIPTEHSRLCSRHFTSESFFRDSKKIRTLKKNATPTIFDFSDKLGTRRNKKYIHCFVPGCKSKCLNKPENVDGGKSIHLFKTPSSDRQFEKWKNAIARSERGLLRSDHVCELHFQKDEIERFYEIRTADGNVIKVDKICPTLTKGAVPSQFLDLPEYIAKDGSKRLPAISDPINCTPKKNKTHSSCAVSEISNDSENDVILVEEKNISTVNDHLTFQKVLENLHLLKKPNSWWNIASVDNFIMCARWNDKYIADKRIVIESNLTIRIFLKEWEINITDLMDITCIDDISALMEKVESYSINFANS